MKRRNFLALLAGLGIGSFALIHITTDEALSASLSISDDTVTSDNGVLLGLTLTSDTTITWDGAENEPGSTTIELQIDHDGSWETIASHTEELTGLAGTFEYKFSNIDVLSNSSWKKQDFRATGDGTTTQVDLDARLLIGTSGNLDGNGKKTFTSNTATFTITVNNEQNSNSASGSGSPNAQGANAEP